VLFFILIAVALFAALAFVMTQNGRGTSTLSAEQARLTASEIVEYGSSLRPIVDRMILMNGVLDTDSPAGSGILFDPPGAGVSPLTRELFDPTGGNAPYMTPPPNACNSTCAYVFTGQYTVTGAGSDLNPELSMLLVDVPRQVCQMVNVVLGLGTTIPTGDPLTSVPFTGTNYIAAGGTDAITLSLSGRAECYQESGGAGRYIYINVIRAR
jgi:hypothetical protein